jgi:hypothetical protein
MDARSIARAIASREPRDRETARLRDVEGLSGEERAATLERSLPAMKSRLHRAWLRPMASRRAGSSSRRGRHVGEVTSGARRRHFVGIASGRTNVEPRRTSSCVVARCATCVLEALPSGGWASAHVRPRASGVAGRSSPRPRRTSRLGSLAFCETKRRSRRSSRTTGIPLVRRHPRGTGPNDRRP